MVLKWRSVWESYQNDGGSSVLEYYHHHHHHLASPLVTLFLLRRNQGTIFRQKVSTRELKSLFQS